MPGHYLRRQVFTGLPRATSPSVHSQGTPQLPLPRARTPSYRIVPHPRRHPGHEPQSSTPFCVGRGSRHFPKVARTFRGSRAGRLNLREYSLPRRAVTILLGQTKRQRKGNKNDRKTLQRRYCKPHPQATECPSCPNPAFQNQTPNGNRKSSDPDGEMPRACRPPRMGWEDAREARQGSPDQE